VSRTGKYKEYPGAYRGKNEEAVSQSLFALHSNNQDILTSQKKVSSFLSHSRRIEKGITER